MGLCFKWDEPGAGPYFGRVLALDPRNAAANAGMSALNADDDYDEIVIWACDAHVCLLPDRVGSPYWQSVSDKARMTR